MLGERRPRMLVLGVIALGAFVLVMSQGCAKQPRPVASPPLSPAASPNVPAGTSQAGKVEARASDARSGDGARPAAGPNVAPVVSAPAKPAPPSDFTAVSQLEDIHFDFDRYEIRPGDAKVLEATARWLKTKPAFLLLVEGHCDERGTNEYNLALGERRARATMNFLIGQGIQTSRITTVSYGKERPLCSEKDERCWRSNRRAHFLVKPS